jgi:hypothetical protein
MAQSKAAKPWWQRKWGSNWAEGPACQPLRPSEAEPITALVRERLGMASGECQTDFLKWASGHGYAYHNFWSPFSDGARRINFIFLCDGSTRGRLSERFTPAEIAVFEDEVRALVPHVYLSPEQLSPPALACLGPLFRPSALAESLLTPSS